MSLATRAAEIPGITLTTEQRDRILASARETIGKRLWAKYENLCATDPEKINTQLARWCRTCSHLGGHDSEKGVGTCHPLRLRVSTWHPVYCNGFRAA